MFFNWIEKLRRIDRLRGLLGRDATIGGCQSVTLCAEQSGRNADEFRSSNTLRLQHYPKESLSPEGTEKEGE